jgi:FkbM family methyltransferase
MKISKYNFSKNFLKSVRRYTSAYFSAFVYQMCSKYVYAYRGENNGNIKTNGELRIINKLLPNCHTVLDVGANKGEWAKLALKVNLRLNLHCFEPSPSTFKLLNENNFPLNVICNNFGLSSTNESAVLKIFGNGSALNSLYSRRGLEDGYGLLPQKHEEAILLKTLDEYCERNELLEDGVDFCKIDVEGHELEVFKGMTKMLGNEALRVIQFEYGGCNIDSRALLKDIFSIFEPYEYTFYKILPRKLLKVDRYDQRYENFQYQNWLVIANNLDSYLQQDLQG